MIDAWFDPNTWAWIPGTVLGCLGGAWGGLAGCLVPRGRGKPLITGLGIALLAASAILLSASVVALATGQPYGVWYGLGLPGLIGLIVVGANLPVLFMAYRKAEQRRLSARDL
jgi:hypothetical protein